MCKYLFLSGFDWVPPEADPETRIRVQIAYSGSDSRKHLLRIGKVRSVEENSQYRAY